MNKINYENIEQYIREDNILGAGKEVTAYNYEDKVIKLFSNNRTSPYKIISINGIEKLSTLPLKYFNKPQDLIIKDGMVIGYTENKLLESELDRDSIDYKGIKEDIILLSDNGFKIQDLYYNYIIHDNHFYFIDLTSYLYIPTEVDFLKKNFYNHNIKEMNIFLIGYLLFNAFQDKSNGYEFTKIYKANEYLIQNCGDNFYGDIKNQTL